MKKIIIILLISTTGFAQETDLQEYLGQEIGSIPYAFGKVDLPNLDYNYFEVLYPCYFLGLPFNYISITTDKENIINKYSFSVKKKITKELFDTMNKKYGIPYRIMAADTSKVIYNEDENSTTTKLIDITTYDDHIVTLKYRNKNVHINFNFAVNTMFAEFKYVKE